MHRVGISRWSVVLQHPADGATQCEHATGMATARLPPLWPDRTADPGSIESQLWVDCRRSRRGHPTAVVGEQRTLQRREQHEQIGGAASCVFIIAPRRSYRLRRYWRTRFGDQLFRCLVQADPGHKHPHRRVLVRALSRTSLGTTIPSPFPPPDSPPTSRRHSLSSPLPRNHSFSSAPALTRTHRDHWKQPCTTTCKNSLA